MSKDSRVIVVPWQWFEEERDREYEQMYRDIESGKTTVEELREKNRLRIGDAIVDLSPPKVPEGPPPRPDRSGQRAQGDLLHGTMNRDDLEEVHCCLCECLMGLAAEETLRKRLPPLMCKTCNPDGASYPWVKLPGDPA